MVQLCLLWPRMAPRSGNGRGVTKHKEHALTRQLEPKRVPQTPPPKTHAASTRRAIPLAPSIGSKKQRSSCSMHPLFKTTIRLSCLESGSHPEARASSQTLAKIGVHLDGAPLKGRAGLPGMEMSFTCGGHKAASLGSYLATWRLVRLGLPDHSAACTERSDDSGRFSHPQPMSACLSATGPHLSCPRSREPSMDARASLSRQSCGRMSDGKACIDVLAECDAGSDTRSAPTSRFRVAGSSEDETGSDSCTCGVLTTRQSPP